MFKTNLARDSTPHRRQGGGISDAVIAHLRHGAGIVLCGQVAAYNTDAPYPPPLGAAAAEAVATRGIRRDRFLLPAAATPEEQRAAAAELTAEVAAGRLRAAETVAEGIAALPGAFVSMMEGGNVGKQIVEV